MPQTRRRGVRIALCALAVGATVGVPAAAAITRGGSGVVLTVAPVPTAAQPTPGTPQLTWSTGDGSPGEVTVAPAESREVLVASGGDGSVAVPWVSRGTVYTFRLYSTVGGRRLLARLLVGHQAAAEVIAIPRKPRITSPPVNRLLQLLGFASILTLALLAILHVREVERRG
jgi:hypothetical protein